MLSNRRPPPQIAALRRHYRLAAYRAVRAVLGRAGYHVVPGNYYSPIPVLAELPGETWSQPAEMPGIDWDLDAQLARLRAMAPLLRELDAPADPPGNAEGYHLENGYFNAMDAEVLYAVIRQAQPRRVLEVGSGFSTLVIAGALQRNSADGSAPAHHEVFDPYPSYVLGPIRDRIDLHMCSATEISLTEVATLRSGDVLFIDSTHAVRPGGDVLHLVLDALPRTSSGVLVQVHDFFRPYEYPRFLMEHFGACWQEHHLVQGLLALSDAFEILLANHALARQRRAAVCELIPSLEPRHLPSSLWLRRR